MSTARSTRPVTHTVDVPLAGWTLRIAMERAPDGTPRDLHFAVGYGRGREWREVRGEGLTVPASATGVIIDALQRLHSSAPAAPPPCRHPARSLVRPRLLETTAGPERVWLADCLACGQDAVPLDADGGPRAVTESPEFNMAAHDRRSP